jgi:hypothetical protein
MAGLREAKGNYILLLDADLKQLQHTEIENALNVVNWKLLLSNT